MAVLSVQDVERFTPASYRDAEGTVPAGAPVYLIAPLTWRERARWRSKLAEEGVRYPQDAELIRVVRTVIAELAPSNSDDLLRDVQDYENLLAEPAMAGLAEGEKQTKAAKQEREAEIARRRAVERAWESIFDQLRQHPAVGSLIGLRVLFNEVVPPMAAAYALRGWENVSAPFQRVNGVVPDRLLDQLPSSDLVAIGNQAMALQSVSAAQRGN